MLRIIQLEEIQSLLLQVPRFVGMLEEKDTGAVPAIKAWLEKIEEALQNNRLPVVSIVAGLRGELISAERGALLDHITIHGRLTTRKMKQAVAADVIKRTGAIVVEAIHGDKERISKAEEICQQLIALARAKSLVVLPLEGMDHTQSLKALWSKLSSDHDIAAGTVNIEGLVGPDDSLIVLDRTLARNTPSD